jgi:26S proteasome regulatory subunit N6
VIKLKFPKFKMEVEEASVLPEDVSALEELLESTLLIKESSSKVSALRALIVSPEVKEEDLRVKERAFSELLNEYVSNSDIASITSLLVFLRPFFGVIPKARTAKFVRSVIESLARIPNSTEAQVALCTETVEWCKVEKRSFLRLRIQLKLTQL